MYIYIYIYMYTYIYIYGGPLNQRGTLAASALRSSLSGGPWLQSLCGINWYPLVIKHSDWKSPLMVDFPMKDGVFRAMFNYQRASSDCIWKWSANRTPTVPLGTQFELSLICMQGTTSWRTVREFSFLRGSSIQDQFRQLLSPQVPLNQQW